MLPSLPRGGQVWERRAAVVPPRSRSCCNAPFSVPQSAALGVGVGKEVSNPPHQSQLTFLCRRRDPSCLLRLGPDTWPGNAAAEVYGAAKLRLHLTTRSSSCGGSYRSCRAGPTLYWRRPRLPVTLTIRRPNRRPGQAPVQKPSPTKAQPAPPLQVGQSQLSSQSRRRAPAVAGGIVHRPLQQSSLTSLTNLHG